MKNLPATLVTGMLASVALFGQHTVLNCGLPNNPKPDCFTQDSATIGGIRYEDYRVTNPLAVQFDPVQRSKQLAALDPANVDLMCRVPSASYTLPAPSITFDKTSVVAQIYWQTPANSSSPSEFMDVQVSNFTASNGFTSKTFGFRMLRQVDGQGNEVALFRFDVAAGAPGLGGVVPGGGGGFEIDPVAKTASIHGLPSPALQRQAILGMYLNAQSILSAAKFTVTNPPPAGKALWTPSELISLAGEARPLIASAVDASNTQSVPLGAPFNCVLGPGGGTDYPVCNNQAITAFSNMLLSWGGEYMSLHTPQSFNVLVSNLRTWATVNAPSIDPACAAAPFCVGTLFTQKEVITTPLVMLWPTLRADPALPPADRDTIDNWVASLAPPIPTQDFFPNDLGYWSDEIVMADAIRRSDHERFAHGIQRFYGALNQMRTDGSFPLAATLSACSAVYSNTDLLHLTAIAEMAATQGYDLYRLSVNGKSLETAIEFLLNAYENPSLLYRYSMVGGGGCFEGKDGDPPDFSLVFTTNNLAWAEAYLARFPLSGTAARLRNILGNKLFAGPFPLTIDRTGLNATCAFRKSSEFQPVSGPKIAIVSGGGQSGSPNQAVPAPLVVRVTDSSGKPVAGELVSFAVIGGSANVTAPAQIVTDSTGSASATVTMGPGGGPATVTATALGTTVSFSITIPQGLAIYAGGITGIGGSLPAVTTISPGALFSIYGQNFVPKGTGRRVNADEIVNEMLPTTLLGVCVTVNGTSAPLLDVYPGQINAVAPRLLGGANIPVIVTTGCGTPNAVQSAPQLTAVMAMSPEFLYFRNNADGVNPVAALNVTTGAYVGPATLGSGFEPAKPGDVVTIFASGFGDTTAHIAPGAVASGQAPVTSAVKVILGSVPLDASDVLYVGAAPGEPISQINIRIPSGAPAGNQPLQIRLGEDGPNGSYIASPPGGYLAITTP
jgi:uncharacterized protein (TIGR03437 family)